MTIALILAAVFLLTVGALVAEAVDARRVRRAVDLGEQLVAVNTQLLAKYDEAIEQGRLIERFLAKEITGEEYCAARGIDYAAWKAEGERRAAETLARMAHRH